MNLSVGAEAPARPGRRFPVLLLSRGFEQAVLGGAAFLVAARLGTVAFAPIGALFVVNSAAVALSDFGVGLAALRCSSSGHVGAVLRRRMEIWNLALLCCGVGIGIAIGGTLGFFLGASAAIWASSAEAFVEKASAINRSQGHVAALAELIGSTVFAMLVIVGARGVDALPVVAGAFLLKHLVEAIAARHPDDVFSAEGETTDDLGMMWLTQVIAFGIANVDYLLVAILLGPADFSVYVIAFRLAVAMPSMVAYVANRTALADYATSADSAERQRRYRNYIGPLFALGIVAAVVATGVAPILGRYLGGDWAAVTPTVAVLALALPWRMIAGQCGAVLVHAGRARELARWKALQLAGSALAYALTARLGYAPFVAVVSLSWIVSVALLQRLTERRVGLQGPRWLELATVTGAALTLIAVVTLWGLSP